MQNDNLNEPNYSTQTSFVSAVRDVFNQYSGTGTVRSLHQGSGISLTPNLITSNGTISLDAGLHDLNNVNVQPNPITGYVLKYSGTCWEAQPVTGGPSLLFSQLSDVDVQFASSKNNLLRINSTGTAVETTPNNYINTFISNGIAATNIGNNTALLNLDASTLNSQSSNNTGEMEFFINNTLNQARKIKQNIVELANFSNESSDKFVQFSKFTAGYGISINTGGNSIVISFNETLTAGIDLSRAHGVLSLHSGGTSASTITGAQENLNLVPNKDILARDGPSFRDRLFGDNIILRPYRFTITGTSIGFGYNTGPAHLLDPRSAGNFFRIDIGSSISGGGVSVGNLIGRDGTCIRTGNDGNYILENYGGNYFTPPSIFSLTHSSGEGSGASFRITPHDQYINFGPSEGEHGFGLRNRHGYIQVRNSELTPDGASWLNLYPQTLSIFSDVNITSSLTEGQVLLYNGTCFINKTLDGGISRITTLGEVFLNLGHNFISDLYGISGVSAANINSLQGINTSSTIQDQIDSKVGISTVSATSGSLIYYKGGTSYWKSIPLPSIGVDEAEILGYRITGSGLSEPSYGSFYDFFGLSETDINKVDARLPVYTYGISRCRLYPLENIFRPIVNTGGDNGLNYDNNVLLTTNYYLGDYHGALGPDDKFSVHLASSGVGTRNRGLSYQNLLSNIVGEGLCVPAGGTSIVLGSSDFLQLNPRTFGTSPQNVSTGAIAFFSDTNTLGVYLGTCWHGISIGSPIAP